MERDEVVIVGTGTANVASVVAALSRLGETSRISVSPKDIESAERVVLPGVGTLASAIAKLDSAGIRDVVRERVVGDRSTLAICLGMQMLCEASDESPGVQGLGVIPGTATRFSGELRVPQLGWNCIESQSGTQVLGSGYVYFANSYRLTSAPHGWSVATADYGGRFVAAVERGRVVACQFHPELSGEFGMKMIRRWLDITE